MSCDLKDTKPPLPLLQLHPVTTTSLPPHHPRIPITTLPVPPLHHHHHHTHTAPCHHHYTTTTILPCHHHHTTPSLPPPCHHHHPATITATTIITIIIFMLQKHTGQVVCSYRDGFYLQSKTPSIPWVCDTWDLSVVSGWEGHLGVK